jgi:hypothetical protein
MGYRYGEGGDKISSSTFPSGVPRVAANVAERWLLSMYIMVLPCNQVQSPSGQMYSEGSQEDTPAAAATSSRFAI